ncbi:hypothetical protein C8Q76DRAFT_262119 [Earliella scabrosa]|nr:hypothetical protein C8Q76DRAFT_262119 [Earliella scabrosa]
MHAHELCIAPLSPVGSMLEAQQRPGRSLRCTHSHATPCCCHLILSLSPLNVARSELVTRFEIVPLVQDLVIPYLEGISKAIQNGRYRIPSRLSAEEPTGSRAIASSRTHPWPLSWRCGDQVRRPPCPTSALWQDIPDGFFRRGRGAARCRLHGRSSRAPARLLCQGRRLSRPHPLFALLTTCSSPTFASASDAQRDTRMGTGLGERQYDDLETAPPTPYEDGTHAPRGIPRSPGTSRWIQATAVREVRRIQVPRGGSRTYDGIPTCPRIRCIARELPASVIFHGHALVVGGCVNASIGAAISRRTSGSCGDALCTTL